MDDEVGKVVGAALSHVERMVNNGIGWATIGNAEADPPHVYTVGYRPKVELIIVGLPVQTAEHLLHRAVDLGIETPGDYDGVIEGFKVRARRVIRDERYRLGMIGIWRQYLGEPDEVDVYQLVWPDKGGVFPPLSADVSSLQPLLRES